MSDIQEYTHIYTDVEEVLLLLKQGYVINIQTHIGEVSHPFQGVVKGYAHMDTMCELLAQNDMNPPIMYIRPYQFPGCEKCAFLFHVDAEIELLPFRIYK